VPLQHARQERLETEERAGGVRRQHSIPIVEARLVHGCRRCNARVVDQDVDAAKMLRRRGREALDARLIADVACFRVNHVSISPEPGGDVLNLTCGS
jgi:hypothetical protein